MIICNVKIDNLNQIYLMDIVTTSQLLLLRIKKKKN